jgi:hypothetical protein
MAKKKRRKKRRIQRPQSRKRESLASRLENQGIITKGQKIIALPEGHKKMSELILEFIEPYMVHTDSDEDVRMLMPLAVMAWNASMLPDDEMEAMLEEAVNMIEDAVPDDPLSKSDREELLDLLDDMVEHKRKHFARYTKGIADYEITEREDGFHLSVISFADVDGKNLRKGFRNEE